MSNETAVDDINLEIWAKALEKSFGAIPCWFNIVYLVIVFAVFVLSLVGNIVTCVVICFDKTMHTATNYYLLNLAVSDALVTFGILIEIPENTWKETTLGSSGCKLYVFLVMVLWNNSILTMTALAVERYIVIWHPLLLKPTSVWKRVLKLLIIIWILAILGTIPEAWTVDLARTKNFTVCFIVPTKFAKLLNGLLAVWIFILPVTILMFVYAAIALKVTRTERANVTDMTFNRRGNKNKVNKLVVAITVAFLICWLPFFMMRIMISTVDVQHFTMYIKWWGIMSRFVVINSWFSMVVNPLLFSLMSSKFRKALKTLWRKILQLSVKSRTTTEGVPVG